MSEAAQARRARRPRAGIVLPLLLAGLLGAGVAAAAQGSVPIPFAQALRILLNEARLAHFPVTWEPQQATILLALRLPRVLAAAVVGAALATAGVLLQGLLRNPLADPYVVGTSGGATVGAIAGIILGSRVTVLGFGIVPLAAFAGALAAMVLVIGLAGVGGRLPIVTVLLAGFAVSTLLGYTGSLLLVLDNRMQIQMPRLYGWLLGGIAVTGWGELSVVGPLVLAGLFAALPLARALNAFSLGEEGAARLGVAVERDKRWILALGSLLTAGAVSVSGLIGFVGLIVPHVVRLACGPDHRLLLPASALAGAIFLVLADLLARTLLPPAELPVGIVTAFLGGPFFLWMLRRSRREYQL